MEYKDIKQAYDEYFSTYRINNQRAEKCISFSTDSDQWEANTAASRASKNKETLTLNNIPKFLNKIKSQNRQIDFQADISQTVDNKNEYEFKSFDLLMKHWFTNKNIQEKFDTAFDKCIDYGYAVAEVNFDREEKETLNLSPTVTIGDNPSEYFFDTKCELKSRIDGNFCGRKRLMGKKELVGKNKDLEGQGFIKEKSNVVVDFWQRENDKCWFVLLKTGVWYRQDLLSDADFVNNVKRKPAGELIRRRGTKDCIYYYRYINETCIVDRRPYPTEDLPLVYHAGLTHWTPAGLRTYPYAFYLMDAQRLVNLVKSQIATTLKNSTASKWFFDSNQLTDDKQKDRLRDINQYEGAEVLNGDPRSVFYVPPTELAATILNYSQTVSQDLELISGNASDAQLSDNAVVSGVAIREITNSIQMINAGLVSEHIRFIDAICHLQTQMMPKIIKEERDFFIKDDNGRLQKIGVNIKTETDYLINDINNIRNKFFYEIKAGATTAMQKQDTRNSLMQLYQVIPPFAQATADIFCKSLDIPEANDLARRALAFVSPDIIKLGTGEITQQQYSEIQKQNQAQAMQGNQGDPSAKMAAQAEMQKSQADLANAETNKIKAQAQIAQGQDKVRLDTLKTMHQVGQSTTQQDIDQARLHLEATQQMIDSSRPQTNAPNPDTQ